MKCNKEITVRMVLIGKKYCNKKGNGFKYAVYPKVNECVSKKCKNVERIIQLMKAKEGKVCVDGVMWYYMCVDKFYVVCVVDGDVGDNGSSVVGELLRKYWDMWKKGKGEVNVSEKRMRELYGKCKEIKCNISKVNEGMNNMRLECSAYDEHEQQQQQHTMMLSKQQDALTILSNDNDHTSSSLSLSLSLSSMQLQSSYITTIIKVNKIKTMFIILCFTCIISIYSSLPFLIRTIM